jgi:hypothetical protein
MALWDYYFFGGGLFTTGLVYPLDEGDFVIQPVLKTGTSLTKPLLLLLKSKKFLKTFLRWIK